MSQLLLLLAASALLFTAAAAQKSDGGEEMLHIVSCTPEKLHARYRTSPEEGIQVVSEANQQNKYVSVTTFEGEQLIYARFSPSGHGVLWKILGYNFFLFNNTFLGQPTVEPYLVPSTSTDSIDKEIKNDHYTTKLFRTLETENFEKSKETAFLELFSLPELGIIFEMSKALGKAGVNGYDNPAALNFHGLALHFAKLQPRLNRTLEEGEEEPTAFAPRRIAKRATCTRNGWWGSTKRYRCNRCPIGSNCVGMCGPGCSCWSWVCGHCCYNQGCYEHDNCCGRRGFWHHRCILPFGFNCSSYNC